MTTRKSIAGRTLINLKNRISVAKKAGQVAPTGERPSYGDFLSVERRPAVRRRSTAAEGAASPRR